MKKFLALSLLATLIVSSCGSNKNFTKKHHQKRKYIKVGEKVDLNNFGEKVAVEGSENDESRNLQHKAVVAKVEKGSSNVPEKADEDHTITSSRKAIKKQEKEAVKKSVIIESDLKTAPVENGVLVSENDTEVVMLEKTDSIKALDKKAVDSDVMFIVLIVLAFLIPPLAVFIYEEATNRFWLNLVLSLLYLGFFIAPGIGILGLIAVIHALLIVLEII